MYEILFLPNVYVLWLHLLFSCYNQNTHACTHVVIMLYQSTSSSIQVNSGTCLQLQVEQLWPVWWSDLERRDTWSNKVSAIEVQNLKAESVGFVSYTKSPQINTNLPQIHSNPPQINTKLAQIHSKSLKKTKKLHNDDTQNNHKYTKNSTEPHKFTKNFHKYTQNLHNDAQNPHNDTQTSSNSQKKLPQNPHRTSIKRRETTTALLSHLAGDGRLKGKIIKTNKMSKTLETSHQGDQTWLIYLQSTDGHCSFLQNKSSQELKVWAEEQDAEDELEDGSLK